jgi:hypothetical protein
MERITIVTNSTTNSANKTSWRNVLPVHPAANLFPLMPAAELRELAEDIKANGLREPVTFIKGETGPVLLDGRNRLDALALLGRKIQINDSRIFEQLSADIDASAYVDSLNIRRRHLTAEQKRELIGKLLKATPEKSDRAIAAIAKVDNKTVAAVRAEKEATEEIPQLEKTTGKDGKSRPAKKKRRRKERREQEQRKQEEKYQQRLAAEDDAEKRAIALLVKHLDSEVLKEFSACMRQCSMMFSNESISTLERAAQEKVGKAPANEEVACPDCGGAGQVKIHNDDGLDIPACLRRTPPV